MDELQDGIDCDGIDKTIFPKIEHLKKALDGYAPPDGAITIQDGLVAYDIGSIAPLGVLEEHCTTVYKVQEAFSSLNLPEGNVYRDALRRSLYGSVDYQFETPSYQMVAEPMTEYGKKE